MNNNEIIKIKRNGLKIKVRLMNKEDIIHEKSLQTFNSYTDSNNIKDSKWDVSRCVGELVSGHPDRTYIEVLSPYYIGESE